MAPSPLNIDVERADWSWWRLVGNESPTERRTLEDMLTEAKRFIGDIIAGGDPRWLVYLGSPGCGKTFLAEGIRTFLRTHGERIYNATTRAQIDPASSRVETIYSYAQEGAIFAKWGRILERAREGDQALFRKAFHDHYKIIDDLGVDSFDREGKATPFATQKMAELLDRRLRKWTVITSNFTRTQLSEQFDARISSRMMRDGSVIVDCSQVRDFNIRREAIRKAA